MLNEQLRLACEVTIKCDAAQCRCGSDSCRHHPHPAVPPSLLSSLLASIVPHGLQTGYLNALDGCGNPSLQQKSRYSTLTDRLCGNTPACRFVLTDRPCSWIDCSRYGWALERSDCSGGGQPVAAAAVAASPHSSRMCGTSPAAASSTAACGRLCPTIVHLRWHRASAAPCSQPCPSRRDVRAGAESR